MMSRTTETTRTIRTKLVRSVDGLAAAVARFAADRQGSTVIEYGLTLGGIALSSLGVTSAVGIEVGEVFNAIGFEFCMQSFDVCTK